MDHFRPNVIPWPPIIYATAAAAGLALHWTAPLPWPPVLLWLSIPGYLLAACAIAFELWASLHFLRQRTTILPNRGATSLITTGPFAISRNPIYVGNTSLLIGFGLGFGVFWLIIAAPIAAYLTQKLAIEREEQHLALKFGQEWRAYAARTPRWLITASAKTVN